MLINLNLKYLCNYTQCDPRFADEINIIYTSTIKKIFTIINGIIEVLDPYDVTTFKQEILKEDMKFKLDLIYYTEKIVRKVLTSLLDTYDECYLNYSALLFRAK